MLQLGTPSFDPPHRFNNSTPLKLPQQLLKTTISYVLLLITLWIDWAHMDNLLHMVKLQ